MDRQSHLARQRLKQQGQRERRRWFAKLTMKFTAHSFLAPNFSARTNKAITFACKTTNSDQTRLSYLAALPLSGDVVFLSTGLPYDKTDGLPRYGCGLKGLVTLRSSDAYDPARRERSELDEGEGGEALHSQ